jgi:hypothetical protein
MPQVVCSIQHINIDLRVKARLLEFTPLACFTGRTTYSTGFQGRRLRPRRALQPEG